jgi:hypothetical protein
VKQEDGELVGDQAGLLSETLTVKKKKRKKETKAHVFLFFTF